MTNTVNSEFEWSPVVGERVEVWSEIQFGRNFGPAEVLWVAPGWVRVRMLKDGSEGVMRAHSIGPDCLL